MSQGVEIQEPYYYANGIAVYESHRVYKCKQPFMMLVLQSMTTAPMTSNMFLNLKFERESSRECLQAYNYYLRVNQNLFWLTCTLPILYADYKERWLSQREDYEWRRAAEYARLHKLFEYDSPMTEANKKLIKRELGICIL